MLLELLVLFLVAGFVWNLHQINELKIQIFDLNQEIVYMKNDDIKTVFKIEESDN